MEGTVWGGGGAGGGRNNPDTITTSHSLPLLNIKTKNSSAFDPRPPHREDCLPPTCLP